MTKAKDRHRPDPDLLQQWVLRDLLPPSQVGPQLGMSRATGYEWLRRYGIRSAGPQLSQDDLVARWQAGAVPVEQLAAEMGLSEEAVRERLITAGAVASTRPYVPVGTSTDPLPEALLRVWHLEHGLTAQQIAESTGTTVRQVRYRLERYGIARRPRGTGPVASPAATGTQARLAGARTDPELVDRLRAAREQARLATANTVFTVEQIQETLQRLRQTANTTRQTAGRGANGPGPR